MPVFYRETLGKSPAEYGHFTPSMYPAPLPRTTLEENPTQLILFQSCCFQEASTTTRLRLQMCSRKVLIFNDLHDGQWASNRL